MSSFFCFFGKIYAIEPAPVNFRKLSANLNLQKENITLINSAVSNRAGEMKFSEKGGRNPYITIEGKISVKVDTLASLLPEVPDIVKLDVEGEEVQVLESATELIKKHAPTLLVSVYHKTEDFINIPLMVKEMQGKEGADQRKNDIAT